MSSGSDKGGPWGPSSDDEDKKKKATDKDSQSDNPWSKKQDKSDGRLDDNEDEDSIFDDTDDEENDRKENDLKDIFSFGDFKSKRKPNTNKSDMPDFEENLQKLKDKMGSLLPNGFQSSIMIVGSLLLAGWFLTGFYRVSADEQGVVQRFGKMVRTEQPGLRYHLPAPIEVVYTPKVTRVKKVEVGYRTENGEMDRSGKKDFGDESLMLTGDENIIDINFTVFWVVKDAGEFLFKIRDPQGTVKKAAESAMREVIGQTEIQPALTEARQEIELKTQQLLQEMLNNYNSGIEITQVQLQKVDPPSAVIDAFNDVQRARADKERLRNEAEAYQNSIVPVARGDAERILENAAAYKDQQMRLAEGDAKRFKSVLDAYQENKTVTGDRLYFEAMETILQNTPKIIIDKSAQGGQGVVPYLPLSQLKNEPANTSTTPKQ